ncbi:MAG: HEPN domain-containing protein [Chloroflexi bacterium]|nr:HEPN domain-containing protein [Chloroflexota bacterium]
MRPEALLEAQEWLNRANRDLRIAAANLRGAEVFPDAAVFFAQQAAEKALKAFLVAHDHPFPRTHDLERLVEWCETIEGGFAAFLGAARTLSPYAIGFRYPGGPQEPEMAEAQEALGLAGEIVRFVHDRLWGASALGGPP